MASATPSATSALRRSAVPKRHRGRDVEQQPAGQRALADVHAHVRLVHARGHVPVDVADVVARPVGPDHRQVGAAADLRREVLARDQALDAAHDREVERAQDLRRDGAGAGALGRAVGRRRDDAQARGSRQPPPAQQRERQPAEQQHQAAAGERRGHLLLLLHGREARRQARVDRLELVARRAR